MNLSRKKSKVVEFRKEGHREKKENGIKTQVIKKFLGYNLIPSLLIEINK